MNLKLSLREEIEKHLRSNSFGVLIPTKETLNMIYHIEKSKTLKKEQNFISLSSFNLIYIIHWYFPGPKPQGISIAVRLFFWFHIPQLHTLLPKIKHFRSFTSNWLNWHSDWKCPNVQQPLKLLILKNLLFYPYEFISGYLVIKLLISFVFHL